MKIAFIHPDLGIGGAERLVVDAAVGLQEQGHDITIYTSHCDLNHCFEEIKNGTLKVNVLGDFLPTSVFGKFYILCANLRQLYLTAHLEDYDLFIVDQLSTCVPFLHYLFQGKVLFYCHFPDQLLAQRTSLLKRLYRIPFDALERFTTSAADSIVVNSNFTKSVYNSTLALKEPSVIYPCVDMTLGPYEDVDYGKFFLSINRYERKKNIELIVRSFALFCKKNSDIKLVIAGGYDPRVRENVEYHEELQDIVKHHKLEDRVVFLTSISSALKNTLLSKCSLLCYSPSNEHFGIVPVEGMKYGKPVLAINNGGPTESIVDGVTGFLREGTTEQWAAAMEESLGMDTQAVAKAGEERVMKLFSREAMTQEFEANIDKMITQPKPVYQWELPVVLAINYLFFFIIPYNINTYVFIITMLALKKFTVSAAFWVFVIALKNNPFLEEMSLF